jgi:hypothetical protein
VGRWISRRNEKEDTESGVDGHLHGVAGVRADGIVQTHDGWISGCGKEQANYY